MRANGSVKRKSGFQKGQPRPPGAGRKPGSVNKTTRLIKDAMLIAAEQLGEPFYQEYWEVLKDENGRVIKDRHGQPKRRRRTRLVYKGIDGLVGYFRWVALHHAPSFVSGLNNKVMPMQIKITHTETRTFRTVKEIREEIIRRGLPLDPRLFEPQTHIIDVKPTPSDKQPVADSSKEQPVSIPRRPLPE